MPEQDLPERDVIVTGATGHLGRHVIAAFRNAGWSAHGVDLEADRFGGIDAADLRDPAEAVRLLGKACVIAHCAALPRPVGYTADEVFSTNMALMHSVLSAAESGRARRVIFASSYSVVGLPFAPVRPALQGLPLTEDEPAAPQDVYALTKWLGEEMLEAFVRRTGRKAVSLRLPWIHTEQSFCDDILPIRDDDDSAVHLWAWIDARDAGRAFVAAAEAEIAGHTRLFLSADDSFSRRPTAELAEAGWPEVALRRPLKGHESLIDAAAARRMLGFAPIYGWQDYARAVT